MSDFFQYVKVNHYKYRKKNVHKTWKYVFHFFFDVEKIAKQYSPI